MKNKNRIKDISKKVIGFAIRNRRKQLNMTMKALADSAGLSVGFISQVERNLTTPSLSSLASIASVLRVEIGYFLDTPKVTSKVSKREDREFFKIDGSKIQYCKLNKEQPGGQLNSMIIKTPAGYVSEKVGHDGEEQIFLLEGKGFVVLEEERFDLDPGDSVYYMSKTPHQYGTRGNTDALWLCVGTQHLFDVEKE